MKIRFPIALVCLVSLVCCALVSGCKYSKSSLDSVVGDEDQGRYIEFVRKIALVPRPNGSPDSWYRAIPDWDLYPFGGTSISIHRDYSIVYADRRYISFRCEEYTPQSGRNGTWRRFTVGSIDRETGKRVTLDDVDAFADRKALRQRLYDAQLARVPDMPQFADRVQPHNNFCLMKDGWHFVYEMGELDDLATGPVELIIGK